jgi:Tfp pilus assembly protein PilF
VSESAPEIDHQVSPKPAAESPALTRVADTKTKISEQPPAVIEPTEPMRSDEKPTARLRPVRPPAPAEARVEDASPLYFSAESKPIESPPSSPRIALPASEPSEGSFVPTVPPMRATGSRALRLSALAPPQSSRIGRWLMVVLFGVLVSLVLVWARHRSAEADPNAAARRAADLDRKLQAARDALSTGDLVLAHDHLQTSLPQGGRDPRWLILTARYDVMRADMNWLAVRIADPNDGPRLEALNRELSDNVAQATRALNAVESIATAEPEMAAVRLDAQRIGGELDRARDAASSLEAPSTSPELAYALAGIELMQQKPRYKEVFEWLGLARAKDSGLGRAPAMLVLACVSGDRLENARAEIQRLKLASRGHPLLAELEAFVQRTSDSLLTAQQAATAASGTSEIVDAGQAEALADVTREGDFRLRLRRAVESLGRNELTRAEQLFRSVLAVRPSDVEALSGLGDVARRHGNTNGAISYYERVLAGNGQYLPALSALADVKFKTGDRGGAAALYRRIVDQVGESAGYGQTAAQRLRELSESSNAKSNNKSDSEKASPPEAPSPAASASIDMTDLPGNKP